MQDWLDWLWAIPGLLVFVYLVIMGVGTFAVMGFSRAVIEQVGEDESHQMYARAASLVDTGWLAEQGFEPAGCFRMRSPIGTPGIVGWKHSGGSIFFCLYLMPGDQYSTDFVSIMSDRNGITTASKADGLLLPSIPGSYSQAFPGKSVPERWSLHLEAETVFTQNTGVAPAESIGPLGEEMTDAIARQIGYVRSLTLWPMRIPVWYITRRYGLLNKTVAQQMK